jgi:putative transposase
MKSLNYPQSGFSLNQKLKVTHFGEFNIVEHRQITGIAKTLTLKRESSGKWFAIFCAETEKQAPEKNTGPKVGLDLGLTNFAALSDGTIIKNPHHLKKWEKKLAAAQRQLSTKKKGSKNRLRAKLKVARRYEKVANCRLDFLHKTANHLLFLYSFIALEKLNIHDMAQQKYGKWINDAAWGTFTSILGYKAEEAGCQLAFVDAENTTKECSACGKMVEKPIWQRQHICPDCGLVADRDINASINILNKATAGIAESNACGDSKKALSLKQEAHAFRRG